MNLLNTEPIERLCGFTYKCECGATHSIYTEDIHFSEGAISALPALCAKHGGRAARVAVLSTHHSQQLMPKILPLLAEFRVETITLPTGTARHHQQTLPEDTRVVVAVGGGSCADSAKYIATLHGVPLILIPDTVRCDAFLSPSSVLQSNGFKTAYRVTPPRAIIADLDIILTRAEQDIVSAYGNIMSKHVALFDYKVANILCGEHYCTKLDDLGRSLLGTCFEISDGARRLETTSLAALIGLNLRSGLYMQLAGGRTTGAETHLANIMEMLFTYEHRELKSHGENLMLCACFVAKVYKLALERDFGCVLPAPDNNLRLDCMVEFLGVKPEHALTRLRPLLKESQLEIRRFRLREFREELLAEITQICNNLTRAYTSFRRLYLDSGFSLINYLEPSDFKLILPLAPDQRERFTLLAMLKDMGLLDGYLPK